MPGTWPDDSHVVGFSRNYDSTVDLLTGLVLSVCLVFGTTANTLALVYFSKISTKSLAEKIYTAISSMDLVTSMTHLPVALSLLAGREHPLLFNCRPLCGAWIILFEFLQRMSIYLIMLLSVSRTIAICCPFVRVKEKLAILSMVPYSGILLIDCIVGIGIYKQVNYYFVDMGYPVRGYKWGAQLTPAQQMFPTVIDIVGAVEIIVPSIIIFTSFIVSVVKMQMLPDVGTAGNSNKRRASVTIAMFTFVFLLLNVPFFLMMVCHLLKSYGAASRVPFMDNWFFEHHGFLLSKVLFVVINASVNPVLYFFRMNRFNRWIKALVLCKDKSALNFDHTIASPRKITAAPFTPPTFDLVDQPNHVDHVSLLDPANTETGNSSTDSPQPHRVGTNSNNVSPGPLRWN